MSDSTVVYPESRQYLLDIGCGTATVEVLCTSGVPAGFGDEIRSHRRLVISGPGGTTPTQWEHDADVMITAVARIDQDAARAGTYWDSVRESISIGDWAPEIG
ncbi:hypothetical protein ABLE92_03845 [Gordonia sp. VNQ95]|uniref:hypothetical protein n=1 Tax=Gordonia sp. VNQ95 TaxID=3156619 RepID=UPI0032B40810